MYFDIERIEKILKELQARIYNKRTRVENVYIKEGDYKSYKEAEASSEPWVKFGEYDVWGDKYKRFWFKAEFNIPKELANEYVVLELTTGKEGQWDAINPQFLSYLNGNIVQGLDTNHREIIVSKEATVGDHFRADFHGYGGMNDGKANFNVYIKSFDEVIEKLFYDIKVPLEVAKLLKEEDKKRIDILNHLIKALEILDLRKPYSEKYYKSINEAREYLKVNFYEGECGKINEGTVVCLGHTHLDVAWLWDLKQTREKAVRSFSTVLSLMKEYPDYTFMASQPILYKFVKEEAPEIYAEIKERIKEGRWEAEGAMYLEADCNLTSGESLVRQILHGKKFFREEFGVENKILWLPDVFGYSAALPQILKGFGIDYFVTSKISWNEYNRLPYDTFMWEGLDGTEILSYFITANDYEKVISGIHRTIYEASINPSQIKGSYERYKPKQMNEEVIISYGYGDGGGGPTKDMLENYSRLNKGIPGSPKTTTKFALDYFKDLVKRVEDYKRLPKWKGELYLEFHRGTYTTIAKNKKYNRMSEYLYQDLELFSSIAKTVDMNFKYDKKRINDNWELILLNQFHDIIPGTSIKEVYDESWRQYESVLENGNDLLNNALKSISSKINLKEKALVVFNQLSFERNEYVELPKELKGKTLVYGDGAEVLVQNINDSKDIAYVTNIPAKGYRVLYIKEAEEKAKPQNLVNVEKINNEFILENKFLKVNVDSRGELTSVFDKKANREVIKDGAKGNSLVIYEDKPHNPWEAWDTDIYYTEKSWEITEVIAIEVKSKGPLKATIRVEKKYEDSTIEQFISLYHDSPRIDFETKVKWHEEHVLLRANFPVNIKGNRATFDIQYGNIERDTHFNTSWDIAKFEVCAHKWGDISEYGYGVALLNDCKYGYSVKDGVLSLTLLKSPKWPNPEADMGYHEFTYSLYPHEGRWQEGKVQEEAYKLNLKPYVTLEESHTGLLEDKLSFIKVDAENVMVEVIKEKEEGNETIVRVFESFNKRTNVKISSFIKPKRVWEVNLEEKEIKELEINENEVEFMINPYEIKTFKIEY
ncbi:alpha-mannosidase [Clostridium sp. 'White wine YQ']|uniref:alpha-mannosidase n=1 Tax=Clostridium sp. 'White wine YQ' TaxID=3027474 RepID=UPI002366FED8|nr:alpha-mannosidase [Clostridium sp. 'White wine YQ']MDD7794368.1 alpha-mannosidase [Clostridium sp. 'White wine YQ']